MNFKADNGNWLTRGLFYETTLADKSTVVYTLKERDHEGYPSLYRLYMEASDPTEYTFATTHMGSWSHWEYLLGNKWFSEYISAWRKELEIKIRSTALASIIAAGKHPDTKVAFAANRYVLSGDWTPTKSKRGAPTKAEIANAAKDIAVMNSQIEEDYNSVMKVN